MDPKGNYAAHTGPEATTWAGQQGREVLHRAGQHPRRRSGRHQHGEGLRGDDRARCRCGSSPRSKAGQAAGGDTRGQQSAALIVVKKNCGVWLHNDTVLRLQVDDNPEPIKELRRLVERSRPSAGGARRPMPGCAGVNGAPK